MRELAVQAANGTNTDSDRGEIQKEIEQLKSEIDRISTDTEFNTKKLLDGSIGNSADVGGNNTANILSAKIVDDNLVAGDYKVTVSSSSVAATVDAGDTNVGTTAAIVPDSGLAMGTYTLEVVANESNWDLTLKNADGEVIATAFNKPIASSGAVEVEVGALKFTWADGKAPAEGTATISIAADLTVSIANQDGDKIGATTVSGNDTGKVSVGGFELNFNSDLSDSTVDNDTTITVKTDAVAFQIGANENQNTKLAINNMSSEALGIKDIDLKTAESASKAITTIDEAIQDVSAERAKLGAIQNRLEHTINNLGTSSENLSAAEARIRDVDMAKEMMEFTKNNILTQAAQAMLAQANQTPQGVLQLLH
ncbi:MAG: flagellin, partial [Clostridiaceae bacterium]|nr:flagellin [Clostridiaceae bacterium]